MGDIGSYETVHRWRKIFLTCTESIKDTAKYGRSVAVTGKSDVFKVRKIIEESDSRYTMRDSAKPVGISVSRVLFILKRILEYERFLPDGSRIY